MFLEEIFVLTFLSIGKKNYLFFKHFEALLRNFFFINVLKIVDWSLIFYQNFKSILLLPKKTFTFDMINDKRSLLNFQNIEIKQTFELKQKRT